MVLFAPPFWMGLHPLSAVQSADIGDFLYNKIAGFESQTIQLPDLVNAWIYFGILVVRLLT